jgi:multiple sugar transport system permease protein
MSLISTFFVVILASLAAYSFARYNVGMGNILFFILTTKMMPAIAVVLPFFLIFRDIGATQIGEALGIGLDKRNALVISYTIFNLPFAIWLMVSFPGYLHGAGGLGTFERHNRLQVLQGGLALAAPGIAVTASSA